MIVNIITREQCILSVGFLYCGGLYETSLQLQYSVIVKLPDMLWKTLIPRSHMFKHVLWIQFVEDLVFPLLLCVAVQWELSILLCCQWEVNCCVVWMSLFRTALAQHSGALCEDLLWRHSHSQYSEKVSVQLHGPKPAAKQHSTGNTDELPNVYSTTSPTALSSLLIYIVVGALACS